jgi:hypothetical protein
VEVKVEITKELLEQMKQVAEYGACNMMVYDCVVKVADALGLDELASLSMNEYAILVSHAWEKGYV